jgi:hypothetical protein
MVRRSSSRAIAVRRERGAGGSSALRLATYASKDLTISLKIEAAAGPNQEWVTVFGAVDSAGYDEQALLAATVDLLDGETVRASTPVDDLGNFILANQQPGTYRLRLRLPDCYEVLIEDLVLSR